MFDVLIQRITEHPRYGPAMQKAVAEKTPLVLNYHTHGPDSGYCVSVCAKNEPLLPMLGEAELEELVHIRGFGESEEQCVPLSTAFGEALGKHYQFDGSPEIFLNGKPLPGASQDAAGD